MKPKKMLSKDFTKLSDAMKKEEKKDKKYVFLNFYMMYLSIFYSRYKDVVICNYKEFMLLDKDQYRGLQMKLKTNEEFHQELKNKKELEDELQLHIDSHCVSEDEVIHNIIRDEGINGRCKHQLTWR